MKGCAGARLLGLEAGHGHPRAPLRAGCSPCRAPRSIKPCRTAADAGSTSAEPDDADSGRVPLEARWQAARLDPMWQCLDAELDTYWAAQPPAGEAVPLSDDRQDASSSSATIPNAGGLDEPQLPFDWCLGAAASPGSLGPESYFTDSSQMYVILFGVGSTDTEGIYSLRILSRDDGLPKDTIIAFSCKEDAERYAGLLEATMEHVPHVCPIEPEELLEFCTDAGYTYRVEALGSLLMPPDYYVGITDWERSLRLRDGKWSVRDRAEAGPPSDGDSGCASPGDGDASERSNATSFVSERLDEVRARLELLLPLDC